MCLIEVHKCFPLCSPARRRYILARCSHRSGISGPATCAPKNTPAEVIEKLNTAVNVSIADANLETKLTNFGGTVLAGSPADFGKLISDETEKWGKVQ